MMALTGMEGLYAKTSELSTVYTLPAYVKQVTFLGDWQYAGHSGLLRLVITDKKGEYKAFLQWIVGTKVLSTVAIKEVNQGYRYIISNPMFEMDEKQKGVLYLNVFERQREKTYKAKIEMQGIGYYRCTFIQGGVIASNMDNRRDYAVVD